MARDPKPDPHAPINQPDPASGRDAFETDPDQTAALIDELERERDRLSEENKKLLLAAAELQNQVRSLRETGPKDVSEARRQVLASVARDVVQAIDTFDLALNHDPSAVSAQSIMQGVAAIRDGLLKSLAQHGITPFAPQPNDPFEPGRHEAVTMMPAEGVEPGRISASFQVGYALHDRILRPAKVAVAPT
jgi:molecular chaperone GrpE